MHNSAICIWSGRVNVDWVLATLTKKNMKIIVTARCRFMIKKIYIYSFWPNLIPQYLIASVKLKNKTKYKINNYWKKVYYINYWITIN